MNDQKRKILEKRKQAFLEPLDPSLPVSRTNPTVGAVFWRAIVNQEKEKAKRYKKVQDREPPSFTSRNGEIEREDLSAAVLYKVLEREVEELREALGLDQPSLRVKRAKREAGMEKGKAAEREDDPEKFVEKVLTVGEGKGGDAFNEL
jgi:hypothetical protein